MHKTQRLAALAVGLVVAACAPSDTGSGADDTAARQEISDRMATFRNLLLSDDPAAEDLVAFWTPDSRTLEPGADIRGADLTAFFEEVLSTSQFASFEIQSYDLFVHGDVAYDIGQYNEDIEADGETQEIRNHYFIRWEKGTDGVWRFDRLVTGARDAPEGM